MCESWWKWFNFTLCGYCLGSLGTTLLDCLLMVPPFYLHSVLKFSRKRKQREVGRRGKRKKGEYLVVLRKLTHELER